MGKKKTPDRRLAGNRKAKALAREAVRRLADDQEALSAVVQMVELLARRSLGPRRQN